jgi:hypothetical protein
MRDHLGASFKICPLRSGRCAFVLPPLFLRFLSIHNETVNTLSMRLLVRNERITTYTGHHE